MNVGHDDDDDDADAQVEDDAEGDHRSVSEVNRAMRLQAFAAQTTTYTRENE